MAYSTTTGNRVFFGIALRRQHVMNSSAPLAGHVSTA
jgi:hypothetical protein